MTDLTFDLTDLGDGTFDLRVYGSDTDAALYSGAVRDVAIDRLLDHIDFASIARAVNRRGYAVDVTEFDHDDEPAVPDPWDYSLELVEDLLRIVGHRSKRLPTRANTPITVADLRLARDRLRRR